MGDTHHESVVEAAAGGVSPRGIVARAGEGLALMNDSHPPCELKLGCRCRGVPGAAVVAVSVDADENVVDARSEGFEDASSPNPNAGARPPPADAGKDNGLSGSIDES